MSVRILLEMITMYRSEMLRLPFIGVIINCKTKKPDDVHHNQNHCRQKKEVATIYLQFHIHQHKQTVLHSIIRNMIIRAYHSVPR